MKIIVILIGLFFVGIGYWIQTPINQIIIEGKLITGEIIKLNYQPNFFNYLKIIPVIKYDCQNINYKNLFNYSNYITGQIIDLYCLNSNPKEIILNTIYERNRGFILIFSGLFLMNIILFQYINKINRQQKIQELMKKGKVIFGQIINIKKSQFRGLYSQEIYYLEIFYLQKIYYSDYISQEEINNYTVGGSICVYLHPTNLEFYRVNLLS